MKRYYNDITDALDNEEFLQTLSHTETKRKLEDLQGRNLRYYINNTYGFDDVLNKIHTNYVAYRVDSKRTIGKFSQKIRDFEEKNQESEERIDEINRVADILSGAEMLEAYANDFNEEAEEHKKKSIKWLIGLAISVIIFIAIIASLLNIQIFNFSTIEGLLANDIKKQQQII